MPAKPMDEAEVSAVWRSYLVEGGFPDKVRQRRLFRLLPTDPRCKFCNAPFRGPGSVVCQVFYGKRPSKLNPRMCNMCENFAAEHQGGAEFELSMLFADVRGSTSLAEQMGTTAFTRLIDRFYKSATDVLVNSDALVDKLVGDQVTGLYVPGFAGQDHARTAIEAGKLLLAVTGHGDDDGPWIPVGVGIHTGTAYVGAVGSRDGLVDITALGDAANTGARLASAAATAEIVVSEAAMNASGHEQTGLERRELALKGREQPLVVSVIRVQPFPGVQQPAA